METQETLLSKEFYPNLRNRFSVYFEEEFNMEPFMVEKASGPKLESGKWETMTIDLIDVEYCNTTTTKLVHGIMKECKKRISSKDDRVIFSFVLNLLSPTGEEIESWHIETEEMPDFDFGENNYKEDSLRTLKIKVYPSSCNLL